MLIVVVLVFFVCWLPTYTLNTFFDLIELVYPELQNQVVTPYARVLRIRYMYEYVQRQVSIVQS